MVRKNINRKTVCEICEKEFSTSQGKKFILRLTILDMNVVFVINASRENGT